MGGSLGAGDLLLSLGEVFLPGGCLNEFTNPGKKVKIFQVVSGELQGEKAGPFGEGLVLIDDDERPVHDLAPSAVNGELFVCQTFVAHIDLQPGGKVLQLLEEERIWKAGVHLILPKLEEV